MPQCGCFYLLCQVTETSSMKWCTKGPHRCQVVAIILLILHSPHYRSHYTVCMHELRCLDLSCTVQPAANFETIWVVKKMKANLSLLNVKHHSPNCLQLCYMDVLKNEWHFCSKMVPHSSKKLVSLLKIMWFVTCEGHCSYRVCMHTAVCRPTALSPPSLKEVLRCE